MKYFSLFFLTVVCLLFSGCIKNELTISFDLSKDVSNTCRILYYASGKNTGFFKETVAQITAGKGEAKLPDRYPTLIYLYSGIQKRPAAVIFAGRGDKIVVKGGGSDADKWEITGNKTTEALSKWRIANIEILKRDDTGKINRAVEDYIAENPNSEASAILLYVYFTRRGNEQAFTQLVSKLGKDVRDNEELTRALSSADIMTGLPDTHSLPDRIVLTGESGKADTVSLGTGNPAMLIFRSGSSGVQALNADSLRRFMARKNGMKIVEIYMEPDSINWRRHIQRDSLSGIKRLWMPAGLADSISIALGVRRLPFFVITDSENKETYRGDNWHEALKK